MANQLKMAVVQAILTLKRLGWSQRQIAGALGVDRGTVARYAGLARAGPHEGHAATCGVSNPAKAPPGSEGISIGSGAAPVGIGGPFPGTVTDSKPATATVISKSTVSRKQHHFEWNHFNSKFFFMFD